MPYCTECLSRGAATLTREHDTICFCSAHDVCAVLNQQNAAPSEHVFQQHSGLIKLRATCASYDESSDGNSLTAAPHHDCAHGCERSSEPASWRCSSCCKWHACLRSGDQEDLQASNAGMQGLLTQAVSISQENASSASAHCSPYLLPNAVPSPEDVSY